MGTESTTAATEVTTQVAPAATETTTTTTTEPAKAVTTTETPAAVTTTEAAKPAETTTTTPAQVAPEKYELKTSEGSLLSKEQVTEIETLARSANLTNEQAQAIVANKEAGLKSYHDSLVAEHQAEVKKWVEDIKADKDLGGDNFGQTLEHSKQAMDFFATEQFKKEVEASGFGNHPGFVRMMAKIGSMMSNNQAFVKMPTNAPSSKRPQDVLYKNQGKK